MEDGRKKWNFNLLIDLHLGSDSVDKEIYWGTIEYDIIMKLR